ncbi:MULTISPECIES: MFS transporter [Niastella]|uniref:MFS transporter n=1 Tax=Niastella soli TaxID=2821487 RepID=A0ABS3Z4R3_9BACT|nr:MFS transporter [Niastella soli]MBO9204371.1 MFS transporter [Niastella soli]
MELKSIFYAWVPKYLRFILLTLMAFVILTTNGVYTGITTDIYSDLGVYAEPYTMASNALYIGMGASLIFNIRLFTRLTNKTLMLTSFVLLLLLNLVCAFTNNPVVTVAATFFIGFAKIIGFGEVYLNLLKIWSPKQMSTARLYPFFYFIALAGLYFMTWFTAYLNNLYSWRFAYYALFIMTAICILLTVVFVENHPLKRKIPLYQLDIPGLLLLVTTMMLINYVVVYGKVEDWFNSTAIKAACFGAGITFLLFIRRELLVKRPLLNIELFRKNNFTLGLVLIILFSVFTPGTFQSAYSGSVLHFESIRNGELNLFLIPGILTGSIVAYCWYKLNLSGQLLTIIGFSALVIYHILMYGRFVTDLNINDFWFPSFFKGFGQALLYISLAVFATAGFPFPQVLKVVGVVVLVRSFLGPGVFSGLYGYFLYAERTRHLSKLASHIDANEPQVFAQGNIPGFYQNIQQQASLTALKEISGTIIIFGLSVIFILIVINLYKRINLAALHGTNRNM